MEHKHRLSPFPHEIFTDFLDGAALCECNEILEKCAWAIEVGDFFNFEIPSDPIVNAILLKIFKKNPSIRCIVDKLRVSHDDKSDFKSMEVHRYGTGSSIGVHTDAVSQEIRVVVNICPRWEISHNGFWILGNDALLKERCFLPPINNTGFAFRAARNTFHALARREAGYSYGLTACLPSN